MKGDTVG
jgi:hypothetical protein